MPRRVRVRATRPSGNLDPALAEFLLTGVAAVDELEARGGDPFVFWLDHELRVLWQTHEAELLAEAARRRIKRPWWLKREAMHRGLAP